MGYRSDVVLIIHKEKITEWMQHLCQHESSRELVLSYRDYSDANFNGEGHLLYRWTSIKWYDTFDEIQEITAFIDGLEDGDHYRFVRTGEEGDDYEERGYLAQNQVYPVVTNYINIDGI